MYLHRYIHLYSEEYNLCVQYCGVYNLCVQYSQVYTICVQYSEVYNLCVQYSEVYNLCVQYSATVGDPILLVQMRFSLALLNIDLHGNPTILSC